jgi:hypothetical protein
MSLMAGPPKHHRNSGGRKVGEKEERRETPTRIYRPMMPKNRRRVARTGHA